MYNDLVQFCYKELSLYCTARLFTKGYSIHTSSYVYTSGRYDNECQSYGHFRHVRFVPLD